MNPKNLFLPPQMALDVLNWNRENREDINFVLESKLLFAPTSSNDSNWKRGGSTLKMTSINAILVTLGGPSGLEQLPNLSSSSPGQLQFPKDCGVRQAALLLIKEKNSKYSMIRVSKLQTSLRKELK